MHFRARGSSIVCDATPTLRDLTKLSEAGAYFKCQGNNSIGQSSTIRTRTFNALVNIHDLCVIARSLLLSV